MSRVNSVTKALLEAGYKHQFDRDCVDTSNVAEVLPLTPAIEQTTAYEFRDFDSLRRYHENKQSSLRYSRDSHPGSHRLERQFSFLHSQQPCFMFSTGMSAIGAALTVCLRECHAIVTFGIIYRKTEAYLTALSNETGKPYHRLASLNNLDELSIDEGPILFVLENPSNPFLNIIDVKKLRRRFPNARIVIDFTLAGLINDRGSFESADICVTSCTKYIGGHNDVFGGLAVVYAGDLATKVWDYRSMAGTILDPHSSYLISRSLKTYDLRLSQALKNTSIVLDFLAERKQVSKIFYPGAFMNEAERDAVASHLYHQGSIISFVVSDYEKLMTGMTRLRYLKMAPTFGSTDSFVEIPLLMSRGLTYDPSASYASEQERILMSPHLCRLSVGCEPVELIIEDLETLLAS